MCRCNPADNTRGNVVARNVVWQAAGALQAGPGLADGGGNLALDPRFGDVLHRNFHPQSPVAASYGTSNRFDLDDGATRVAHTSTIPTP